MDPTGAGHPLAPHDVGGRSGPPVIKDEHDHVLWERRVDAMMVLLTHPSRQLLTTDELRRHVEELGPGSYESMAYYERWIASVTAAMIERGIVTIDEVGRAMARVEEREARA